MAVTYGAYLEGDCGRVEVDTRCAPHFRALIKVYNRADCLRWTWTLEDFYVLITDFDENGYGLDQHVYNEVLRHFEVVKVLPSLASLVKFAHRRVVVAGRQRRDSGSDVKGEGH